MPRIGDRISEYILTEKCGEGGFGEVWKANHHIFAADAVAVKIPTDTTYVDFLRNEGVIQHNLQHPHIVRTLGLDPNAQPPYFVMEYVEGKALRALLGEKGRLAFREAADIAIQILEALAFAHDRGVTHRDLKPENILLALAGPAACDRAAVHQALGGVYRVKISDFGLGAVSRAVTHTMYLSGLARTQAGKAITGTIEYMAPEQRRGSAEADPRADVYSAGIVLYEMLVGEIPVGAFRYPAQVRNDVPAEIDLIIRGCLLPDPRERFASAREVLEDLVAAVEGRPMSHVARLLPAERSGFEPVPLAQLAPMGVFIFRGGAEAATIQELANAADANWEDAKHHLYSGDIESWLRHVGEKELSRKAMEIHETIPDRNVGLEGFLQATGRVARPRIELDVERLDFPDIPRGLSRRTRVYVNNLGRGWLSGNASSSAPWLKVLTPHFQGDDVPVDILVDSDKLKPGETHSATLTLRSNGGEVQVPVSIGVVPQPAKMRLEEKRLFVAASARTAEGYVHVANDGDAPLAVSAEAPYGCVRFHETFPLAVNRRYRLGFTVDVAKLRAATGGGERVEVPVTVTGNGGTAVVPIRLQVSEGFPVFQLGLGAAFAGVLFVIGAHEVFVFQVVYLFGLFRLLYKMSQATQTAGTEPVLVERAAERGRSIGFWGAFCLVATILLIGKQGQVWDKDARRDPPLRSKWSETR
ncbi:MAG: serine/threonine protein kinase [Planctomycetota bacterium]|nr:MAG: serine/threonine protein kinase [Planctomycetota bacterium]